MNAYARILFFPIKRIDETATKCCFKNASTKNELQSSEAAAVICRELLDYQGNVDLNLFSCF